MSRDTGAQAAPSPAPPSPAAPSPAAPSQAAPSQVAPPQGAPIRAARSPEHRVAQLAPDRRAPAPLSSTQGTLALEFSPRLDPPATSPTRPGDTAEVVPIEAALKRQLHAWARRYAQAVVEIVNGDRPASQLVRWTAPAVFDELNRRAQLVARAGVHQAGLGRGRRPVVRPTVQNVHACFISTSIAEVSVHVRHGARSRAIAARFEHHEGRWLCTALEFA